MMTDSHSLITQGGIFKSGRQSLSLTRRPPVNRERGLWSGICARPSVLRRERAINCLRIAVPMIPSQSYTTSAGPHWSLAV